MAGAASENPEIPRGSVESRYLIEGLEDWIGLWRFAREIRDKDPTATADTVRRQAMRIVHRLVVGGYMQPGRLIEAPRGFSPWCSQGQEAVERIDREWSELGSDPNIADICWFANTEYGDQLARQLVGEK